MSDFLLPDVGEGLTEAEIVSWHVKVGDVVAVNDVLCEIETAKSIVELPSPYAGEITAILVEVGQTISVGTPIISIGADSPGTPAAPAIEQSPAIESDPSVPAPPGAAQDGPGDAMPTLVGYGPRGTERRRRQAPSAPPAGVLAKPPVRLAARRSGLDLRTIPPTGPKGEVTLADLDTAMSRAALPPGSLDGGRITREPLKGIRRAMSEAMTASAFTAPHATVWTTIDATAAVRRVAEPGAGSPLVTLAHAVTGALTVFPLLNSVIDGDEIVLRHWVNLGVAVASDRGLIVPNVKNADLMNLAQLSDAIADLVAVARAGRAQPADQAGGTFTITNVGPLGVDGGTPIINPGQSAIMSMGQIARRPWVVEVDGEERLAIRDVVTLALSFDHRHIDGATAAAFLKDVAARWTREPSSGT